MDFAKLEKYLISSNENMNLYGSYIIKNFILEEPDSEVNLSLLVNQINPKYLSLMVNLLSKKIKNYHI